MLKSFACGFASVAFSGLFGQSLLQASGPRPNPLAPWELRVGSARVYYEAVAEPRALVTIRAIGVKHRERVRIGRTWWQA